MRYSRSVLFAAGLGASAAAFVRFRGGAAQFSYKLANEQTETNPINVQNLEAAKRILESSGGQLEIRVFPDSQLGDQNRSVGQTRLGAIELLQISSHILADVVPVTALETIPFAFPSYVDVVNAVNGPLGAYTRGPIEKVGLQRLPGAWYEGTQQIENAIRPVNGPADLRGLKVRVPPAAIDVALFKAFGASPTVLPSNQTYVALQTKLVDGLEVVLGALENFKFYEHVKYVAITNHSPLNYVMVANSSAWKVLPDRLREIVEREFNAAAVATTASVVQGDVKVEQTLRSQGMIFNRPPIEPFRQAIRNAGLYAQWRDASDPEGWKLLERAVGKLT